MNDQFFYKKLVYFLSLVWFKERKILQIFITNKSFKQNKDLS
jgi:hypothetical protein